MHTYNQYKITNEVFFTYVHTKDLDFSVHFTFTVHLIWIRHSSTALCLVAILLDCIGLD